jgi:hypothetical protein
MPSRLRSLVKNNPLNFIRPKPESYAVAEIKSFDLMSLNPAPVLFHSGHLTIGPETAKKELVDGEMTDVKANMLRMPNSEIRECYRTCLFQGAFDPDDNFFSDFAEKLPIALLEANSGDTVDLLHDLLVAVASEHHEYSEMHCHALIQAAFMAAGLQVLGESSGSAHGKSDMALPSDGKIRVVIEVKYCRSGNDEGEVEGDKVASEKALLAALDRAEEQTRAKDCAAPFRVAGCTVIGVALDVRGRDEVAVRFIEP